MSSQSLEQRFVPHNSYSKKVSDTAMPVDEVEAWLDRFPHKRVENKENGGIIRATESVIFTDMQKRKLGKKDIAIIKAQAQRDFKRAMRNLREQDTIDAKAIKKQQAIWRAEALAAEKARAKEAKRVRASKPNVASKKLSSTEAKRRREVVIAVLKSGGRVPLVSRELKLDYDRQFYDMQRIFRLDLNVVLIRKVEDCKACYVIDNFDRYQVKEKLKTDMRRAENRSAMLKALRSGQLLTLSDVDGKAIRASGAVRNLAINHNLNVYTVLSKKKTVGWILLN